MTTFAELVARQVNQQLSEQARMANMSKSVRSAMDGNEFDIFFQPIVELKTMETIAFEALGRFHKEPYRSPDVWIDEANKVSLGVELEIALIKAAVSQFGLIAPVQSISINASYRTIVSGQLEDALDEDNLHRTTLELTEQSEVEDYANLLSVIRPLQERGMKLAVDDAGAGYAGLQQIIQVVPDIIKLDMSLIRGLDNDPARRALVKAMTGYAQEMGITLVAEGVETADELRELLLLGVQNGQGYLLGHPERRSNDGDLMKELRSMGLGDLFLI